MRMVCFRIEKTNEGNGAMLIFCVCLCGFELGPVPGPRGGHQFLLLPSHKLLLHGGFSGSHDLSDLWSFDLISEKWTQLSYSSEPSARAVHQCVWDSVNGKMWMLGRYLSVEDSEDEGGEEGNELWYHSESEGWVCRSADVEVSLSFLSCWVFL